jgi:hypothetical protein
MLGFEFKPTWTSPVSSEPGSKNPPMTQSGTYNMAPFHAAPFLPPYMMFEGYGNQNSTNLNPLNNTMVPATDGLFGPLFGNIGPGTCPANAGVGPMFAPARHPALPTPVSGSAVGFPTSINSMFPDPLAGRCRPHQDDPYDPSRR